MRCTKVQRRTALEFCHSRLRGQQPAKPLPHEGIINTVWQISALNQRTLSGMRCLQEYTRARLRPPREIMSMLVETWQLTPIRSAAYHYRAGLGRVHS